MKCRHFFSFVLVLFLSLFFGSFITSENSFATTVSFPSSSIFPCSSNCSDYSYLHVSVSSDPVNVTRIINIVVNGSRLVQISSLANSSLIFGQDFYFPIPSGTSSLEITTSNWQTGTLTYDLLTSVSSDCSPAPSGNISITSNGTYDVSSYATATVDVPAEVIQGDYHDDLVNIQNAIIICGAILLVLYFFYCIYRLIIKNSGVH